MKKKYRVTSPHRVHGHAPGSTFEAELDPTQEAQLLEGGFLTRVLPDVKTNVNKKEQ